jgi:two-component system response regulator FixJ
LIQIMARHWQPGQIGRMDGRPYEPVTGALPPLIVAVVDDDEAVRESLRFLLETVGFRVETFGSAAQFLQSAACAGLACLLLDQHMPRVTGLDLLRELRRRGESVRVALMTGSPSPEIARHAAELGAAAVTEKPLADEALLRFVARGGT